jgi:hypothetical protein
MAGGGGSVSEHPQPPQPQAHHTIAAQLARLEQATLAQGEGGGDGTTAYGSEAALAGGTVSRGMLYDVMGSLLGGPAQLSEFQSVMSQLQYDTKSELSFEEVSQGLQCLGESVWLLTYQVSELTSASGCFVAILLRSHLRTCIHAVCSVFVCVVFISAWLWIIVLEHGAALSLPQVTV